MKIPVIVSLAVAVSALNATAAAPVTTPLAAYAQALQTPGRVAADAAGNCYVTDPQAGNVVVYDAFGRVAFTRAGFSKPLGIAVDAVGRIYVGEEQAGSVTVYDSDWNLLHQLGAGAGEFKLPNYIAVDPDPGSGLVFVSDGPANQIRAYTNGGAFAFAFGTQGSYSGEFDFPAGIVVSPAGEVFVVDQKNDRVQVFSRAGTYLRRFKLGSSGFNSAGRSQGVSLDASNHLFVVESFQSFVRSFATTGGAALGTNGGYGSGFGQFSLPMSPATDPFNRLFISSVNNGRVEILGVDDYLHFSASPSLRTVAAGSTMQFSVQAGGAGPFTYQWRRGGGNLADGPGISGATGPTLTLAGLTSSDTGNYSVVVTSPSGARTGPDAMLVVVNPPFILASPISQTVAQGTNVTLAVTAAGDNLVYQWTHDGVPLPMAVTGSLSLENVQQSDSGSYSVTVQNEVGSMTSEAASLTVLIPPAILNAPVGQAVAVGGAATFDVSAAGDGLQYQWSFNGAPLPGATGSALMVTNAQLADAGSYSVRITSPVGEVSSPAALLTVVVPPAVPQIEAAVPQADGTIQISVQAEAGFTFSLQASTDLDNWEVIASVPSVNGLVQFVDPDAPNHPSRFYRVVWRP